MDDAAMYNILKEWHPGNKIAVSVEGKKLSENFLRRRNYKAPPQRDLYRGHKHEWR